METIFDHDPTRFELNELGANLLPRDEYIKILSPESLWVELAFLFRLRNDGENEARAWSHVPFRRDEFLRGFDVIDLD